MNILPKKFVLLVILIVSLLLLLQVSLVYILDPFQIYHQQLFYKDVNHNSRYENAGIINTYLDKSEKYDSVIIGTSLSQNFSPKYIKEALNWDGVLNLTLSGGNGLEKRIVLEKALSTGNVKNVLWEVYRYPSDKAHTLENGFPDYLYKNKLSTYKYLISKDSLIIAMKDIVKQIIKKGVIIDNLEDYNKWYTENIVQKFSQFNSTESLLHNRALLAEARNTTDWASYQFNYTTYFPSIDRNMLSIIQQHPEINFVMFFPPISTLSYARLSTEHFNDVLSMRKYVVEQLAPYDNVEIYAFDTYTSITNDINHYMDVGHYNPNVNNTIIDFIEKKQYKINDDNINEYINRFIDNVKHYQVYSSVESASFHRS